MSVGIQYVEPKTELFTGERQQLSKKKQTTIKQNKTKQNKTSESPLLTFSISLSAHVRAQSLSYI